MGTNDTFLGLVRDLTRFTTPQAYREQYEELARQVNAERSDSANHMPPEAMHAAILHAHNEPQQSKT